MFLNQDLKVLLFSEENTLFILLLYFRIKLYDYMWTVLKMMNRYIHKECILGFQHHKLVFENILLKQSSH